MSRSRASPLHIDTEYAPVSLSDSLDGRRKSDWIAFPFKRIAYGLLAVVVLGFLASATYGSIVGVQAYRRLVFPHRAVHASTTSLKSGNNIVKPYFAPAQKGGVANSGALQIRIWHREGTPLPPRPKKEGQQYDWMEWNAEEIDQDRRASGAQGYIMLDQGRQNDWEQVWTGQQTITDIGALSEVTYNVVLPARVVCVQTVSSNADSADGLIVLATRY